MKIILLSPDHDNNEISKFCIIGFSINNFTIGLIVDGEWK